MKKYVILVMVALIITVLIPLKHLPHGGVREPQPFPQNEQTDAFDGETFLVLDTDSGEVSEWTERDFLIGTVACEMSPSYHKEALKAQAVAAYTYYSVKRAAARSADKPNKDLGGADFSDVPTRFPEGYTKEGMKERWGDKSDEYYNKIANAVDEVLGQKLYHDGKPICALYHAISFGVTETAKNVWGGEDYPYLCSVPSPGDETAPKFATTVTVTEKEFEEAVTALDKTVSLASKASKWIGKITPSKAGTVLTAKIGDKEFAGVDLREAFGLRSACFAVAYQDGSFTFTVKGYGHGVGMSQYGANYLAGQGAAYKEILQFYYTDVEIRI